jgi:hypothetical protein
MFGDRFFQLLCSKCKELSEPMESATKGELLHLRYASLDKALERRHCKMAEFAKNMARRQGRAKAPSGANQLVWA